MRDLEVIRLGTSSEDRCVMQVPLAITMVLEGSLKGAGDTRFLLVTFAGMWLVRVPLSPLWFGSSLCLSGV
jgi:Na+-driven multidrug efflux pump